LARDEFIADELRLKDGAGSGVAELKRLGELALHALVLDDEAHAAIASVSRGRAGRPATVEAVAGDIHVRLELSRHQDSDDWIDVHNVTIGVSHPAC
jgi:hypothetical protein